jgi:hypothetical protein
MEEDMATLLTVYNIREEEKENERNNARFFDLTCIK